MQSNNLNGKNVWRKGHKESSTALNLRQFPSDIEISDEWQGGPVLCQNSLMSSGIAPKNDDIKAVRNKWFFSPHSITATTEKQLSDQLFADCDDVTASFKNNNKMADADRTRAGLCSKW